MKREQLDELKEKLRQKIAVAKEVEKLGGFTVTVEQSDKLGFNWIKTSLKGVMVKAEYIEQENPVGVQSNPFTNDSVLLNNAFYLIDGKMYVYMNGQMIEW